VSPRWPPPWDTNYFRAAGEHNNDISLSPFTAFPRALSFRRAINVDVFFPKPVPVYLLCMMNFCSLRLQKYLYEALLA